MELPFAYPTNSMQVTSTHATSMKGMQDHTVSMQKHVDPSRMQDLCGGQGLQQRCKLFAEGFMARRALEAGVRCLQGFVCRVGLLTHILDEAVRQEEQGVSVPITAADLSCSLLTRLKSMLHDYSLQGGPRGQCRVTPRHCFKLMMTELH